MKAGFLQYDPKYLAVSENLETVRSMIEGLDADLLVLPEFFATGYFFHSARDVRSVAERADDGPTVEALSRWVREFGTTMVAGFVEEVGGALHNSALTVTPGGNRYVYRKCHLYYEEKTFFRQGSEGFATYPVSNRSGEEYRLGVMICYDWRFPESARALALKGADIIAHPANLVRTECPSAMPIRALENHVFTITANRTGAERKGAEELKFIGQSLICDPMGRILARADSEAACVTVIEIDPRAARDRSITDYNDVMGDRRPEVYDW